MKIPTLFKEYIWLLETIHQAGKISLAEINEKWRRREDSCGTNLPRTTFNRHRDAILDMFGVIIECDRSDGNRYYISNKDVLKGNSVANWLFSTLSVGNMLDENIGLQNRILLESIPSGGALLRRIIKAMRDSRKIIMRYRKYSSATAKTYLAEPYCVKLFKRRWYVLTKIEREKEDGTTDKSMSVFSLDRIADMELTQEKFILDADFDAEKYFAESFGIMVDTNIKPERIVLRAYGMERYYLRDLPLHPSQREIAVNEESVDFEIRIRPASDFKAHILSRGEWLQVIAPAWLAEDIMHLHKTSIEKITHE